MLFKCRFVAWRKGLPQKFADCVFVLIDSVVLNLLWVWKLCCLFAANGGSVCLLICFVCVCMCVVFPFSGFGLLVWCIFLDHLFHTNSLNTLLPLSLLICLSLSATILSCCSCSLPSHLVADWELHNPIIARPGNDDYNNNNNGYLEHLTHTGPKCLHILYMHIFS